MDPFDGILLIDKPSGITSHDVVARVRRAAKMRGVGHTGTLDPMATGLMIVCLGGATRVSQFLVGLDKTYTGTIRLGAISSTYDAEGEISEHDRPVPRNVATLRHAMQRQVGFLNQLPPPHSAIKVNGRKLYEYARAGEPVPRTPRAVRVKRFDMVRFAPPDIDFEAAVGSGTYIRSMAHDLGVSLECGGYLTALRRTQVGGFDVEHAVPLIDLMAEPGMIEENLLSVSQALTHLPKITLDPRALAGHLNGQPFTTAAVLECDGILSLGQPILVIDTAGNALSIVTPQPERAVEPSESDVAETVIGDTPMVFRPVRVLARREAQG